jgi:hypothetical protein
MNATREYLDRDARGTSMDIALIVGAVLMCIGAAATAVLFAVLVHAIPGAALKGLLFVAVMLTASTFVNSRLRHRMTEEGKDTTSAFTVFLFLTQFFLALAWAALVAAIIIMLRT